MKSVFAALSLLCVLAFAQVVPGPPLTATSPTSSISGQIQTPTGGFLANGTLQFTLSQPAVVSGTSSVAPSTVSCYTGAVGNIVGVPNPLAIPVTSTNTSSGMLAAGTYYVKLAYVQNGTAYSLPSPEATVILSAQGSINVTAPAVQPTSASGYAVYIGSTSGGETLQATIAGWAVYAQTSALVSGALPVTVNNSACNLWFSDSLIPSGTFYTVNLLNQNGSQTAGYPQNWCTYGGNGANINISQGTPTGSSCGMNGVFYPTPILGVPPGNAPQSISGNLSIGGNLSVTSGSTTTKTLNAVLNAAQYPGSDIGAQINSAYASSDCPAAGCVIVVPTSTYGFSTPVNFATNNKPVMLDWQGSVANYIGTTGVSVTFQNGANLNGGMRNVILNGPGNTTSTTGFQCGGGTGAQRQATFTDVLVTKFGTGLLIGNNCYLDTFIEFSVQENGANGSHNFYYPGTSTGSGESLRFYGGLFTWSAALNGNANSQTCADIEGNPGIGIEFYGTSFDQCAWTINTNGLMYVRFIGAHFENSQNPLTTNGAAGGTPVDFLLTGASCGAGCNIDLIACDILEDASSTSRTELISLANGTVLNISGGNYRANESISQIVNGTAAVTISGAIKFNSNAWTGGAITAYWIDPQHGLLFAGEPLELYTTSPITFNWNVNGTNGNTLNGGTGAPAGNCTTGSVFLRNDPPDASHVIYVCAPANTWSAVTVP